MVIVDNGRASNWSLHTKINIFNTFLQQHYKIRPPSRTENRVKSRAILVMIPFWQLSISFNLSLSLSLLSIFSWPLLRTQYFFLSLYSNQLIPSRFYLLISYKMIDDMNMWALICVREGPANEPYHACIKQLCVPSPIYLNKPISVLLLWLFVPMIFVYVTYVLIALTVLSQFWKLQRVESIS